MFRLTRRLIGTAKFMLVIKFFDFITEKFREIDAGVVIEFLKENITSLITQIT